MVALEQTYHPPRRKPGQRSLDRILAAAEEQLRQEDLDHFTIQSVLDRAGLSVGAFYARFPDKTALLHELQKRVHGRVEPLILAGIAAQTGKTASLADAVEQGFGTLIRHILSERELLRAFMMLSVFDPVMRDRGEQFNLQRKRAIAGLLAPHRDEIAHEDPESAVDSAYAIHSSTMRGRFVYYRGTGDTESGVADDRLFRDLRRSLTSFLCGCSQTPAGLVGPAAQAEDGQRCLES